MLQFSLLDLSLIPQGKTAADALAATVDLARWAERWGYHRIWLTEHHNMSGIASAATAVVIGHVAAATSRIRVGAGGIMLPNHAPLMVAEAFGTLATLYTGRIDLGLGRAPGTDMATARALRRHMAPEDSFPADVQELIGYLDEGTEAARVRAIPGCAPAAPENCPRPQTICRKSRPGSASRPRPRWLIRPLGPRRPSRPGCATYLPDEMIVTSMIHDHKARLRSFEITAKALKELCP